MTFTFFKQNKRRLLDQGKQSQDASEKREPQRCWSGHMNGCQGDMSTEELENKISKMVRIILTLSLSCNPGGGEDNRNLGWVARRASRNPYFVY